MSRTEDLTAQLTAFCGSRIGRDVNVTDLMRFSGGASRETWAFTLDDGTTARRLVLRRDPAGNPRQADPRTETELLTRARVAGVPVPEVIWTFEPSELGSHGFVMEHIEGETIARKILRDDEFAGARECFAEQCGAVAANIHSIDWDGIPGLTAPERKPTELVLDQYEQLLDGFGEPHPVFEAGLRWLRQRVPASDRLTVVHGDFRLGNLIVGVDGVRAVLDWELPHIGDPWEDLAWLCTRSWRFGGDKEVGGIGDRDVLYGSYEKTSGIAVDASAVRWWEVMSSVKWGVMCIGQAFTHLMGRVPSLELAAIGRRSVECEHDVLELIS